MSSLQLDETTLLLGVIVVALLLLGIYLRSPPPHVHPFLLGRQSTISPTRFPSESPVYSNSSTGGIRAPLKPEKTVRSLKDILEKSETCLEGGRKGTWIKGGEKLKTVVYQLRAGLLSTLGKGTGGTVAVLVEDPTDALLVTLALVLTQHTPLVISPSSSLPSSTPVTAIIQSHTLFAAAESISASPNAKWISLGGQDSSVAEDLLVTGKNAVENGEATEVADAQPSDLALTIVSDGVALPLTHLNLTASLVSWLSLFPASPRATRPTVNDTLWSFHHPSTPYGFGLALLAIFTSSSLNFQILPAEAKHEDVAALLNVKASPLPSLIFAPSATLSQPLYTLLLDGMKGDSAFIIKNARDGKLRLLREGVLAKQTVWDNLLWSGLRTTAGFHKMRALVLEGRTPQSRLEFFRMAFGTPAMSSLAHPFVLAPVAASLMWDLQRLPTLKQQEMPMMGSVGPPVVGVDLKLKGDESEIAAGRIRGEILIRTPLLPLPTSLPSSLVEIDDSLPSLPPYPEDATPSAATAASDQAGKWLRTGIKAEMGKEGALWLE